MYEKKATVFTNKMNSFSKKEVPLVMLGNAIILIPYTDVKMNYHV